MWLLAIAHAADLPVGPSSTYLTIADALSVAVDGDRLVLEAHTFTEDVNLVDLDVTLVGAGQGLTTINGGFGNTLLWIRDGTVVLEDLTVDALDARRALLVETATLTASRVTVTGGNEAAGGGMHLNTSTVALSDCTIVGNNANAVHGGGVNSIRTTLTVDRCTFDDNHADTTDANGGAIHAWSGSLTVRDSTFTANTAAHRGAAIAHDGAGHPFRLERSTLTGNDSWVGTVHCNSSDVCDVVDSWFEGNVANSGGAVYAQFALASELAGNVLCANSLDPAAVVGDGGAVMLRSTPVSIHNNLFLGNDSNDWAGALGLYQGGGGDIVNNTFVGNVTEGTGGAIFSLSTSVLVNNVFVGNIAPDEAVVGPSDMEFNLFSGNTTGDANKPLPPSNLFFDPALPPLSCDAPTFHSPALIDVGDPTILDIDGTPSDLGAFGGPTPNPYGDADGDGLSVFEDCDDQDPNVLGPDPWWTDGDMDGFGDPASSTLSCQQPPGTTDNDQDCDDTDASANPDAVWYPDMDGDGFGDPAQSILSCLPPADHVANELDCDDTDASANPDAVWYLDNDDDGFGDDDGVALSCTQPPNTSPIGGDCDPSDPTVFPGAVEVCDNADNDCDGFLDDADADLDPDSATTWHFDGDADGYGIDVTVIACAQPTDYALEDGDCDDDEPEVNPGAPEQCDGVDNDCNGQIDDNVSDLTWYRDLDQDGFGDDNDVRVDCSRPLGFVLMGGDCNDEDPTINPFGQEVCDGLDNDCNGQLDDDPADGSAWFPDLDGDGFGSGLATQACTAPPDFAGSDDDCNDNDADVFPGAVEVCDGGDTDCNGIVDDDPIDPILSWRDDDDDGYGNAEVPPDAACFVPDGNVDNALDCDDADALSHPNAPELCDEADNDCDGKVDEQVVDLNWYIDADGDGFGDPETGILDCAPHPDRALNPQDCDDTDADVNPDGQEIWYDGVDQDCDGNDDDQDGDGWGVVEDCDDRDPRVNPGANDRTVDGVDQNCDGEDGIDLDREPDEEPDPPMTGETRTTQGCTCDASSSPTRWPMVLPLLLLAMRRRARS